jgi:dethiobiotin synthetase
MTQDNMPARAWFITGTDTEIGKTYATCTLLHAARAQGLSALGMKPVAAGTEMVGGEQLNEDVAALRAASSFDPGLRLLNPWCFASPIAPHIAAAEEGVRIGPAPIIDALGTLRQCADVVLVEGVGGFRVPLAEDYDSADLAAELGLPVILVVGLRLGCINHALLTVEAIERRGLKLAGWIGNRIDPQMLRAEQNIDSLRERIPAPLLGVLPWSERPEPAAHASHVRLPD